MKRTWLIIGAGVLISAGVDGAEDDPVRTALNQAFATQKALPGYVEHQMGRMAAMPGATETLADMVATHVKEKATEKLQEKVAQSTARVPVAGEVADRALARLSDQAEGAALTPSILPEREIATVQHAGKRERHVLADGQGELVRGDGQMAYKYSVPPQVLALQLVSTVQSAADVAKEARSAINSIKAISSALAKGASGDVLGAAVATFDAVTRLLSGAKTTADLVQAAAMMQSQSGVWQCQPDRLGAQYQGKLLDVTQLADETVGDVPTHVYFAVWGFGAGKQGFQLESRVWIRLSDGLPLRSEFSPPGGESQVTEFEYPAVVDFPSPVCATPVS
jgi:hypothetical protein